MIELACTLVFILAWLVFAGTMNYKIWRKPDDIWRVQQEEQAPPPGGPFNFRRFVHLDPLGLESHRGRFLWMERIVAGLVLLIGIGMLVGVIGQMVAVNH